MSYSFDAEIDRDLTEQIDRDLTERILSEAQLFADDICRPHAQITPPQRIPDYVDLEAARMVGYAICRNVTTEEFFYRPIRQ